MGVIGEGLERRMGRDNRRNGRRLGERRDKRETEIHRLPRLTWSIEAKIPNTPNSTDTR